MGFGRWGSEAYKPPKNRRRLRFAQEIRHAISSSEKIEFELA